MDGSVKRKRELNPGKNAMLLSKITFFFVFSIFRHSVRKDFNDDDVYETISDFRSKQLGDRLDAQWQIQRKKKIPSYFKAICKAFGVEYLYWGVLTMIVDVSMMIVKPLLIGKVVAYFVPNQTKISIESVMTYAILLIACVFANILFSNSYSFIIKQLCLKINIATSTLIYRKILKLNMFSTTKATGGQAVTLITKDIATLEKVMIMCHQLVTGILQIMVMTYMIYVQIGVSAFVGLAIILMFIVVQAFTGSKVMGYRLATAQKTDERIQLTQEVLSAIRVIKMYTWEAFFYKCVDKLRRKEIRYFQILTYLKSFCLALGLLNTKLALYSCVITFVALGNHITAEKAFVVTGCFITLRVIVQVFIPLSFVKIAEFKASLSRINNYLMQDEVSENRNSSQMTGKQVEIVLENITVSYGNQAIIKNISLTMKPGLTLVIGAIGSGKSILLKAILGEAAARGKVEISGKVSYAAQDPWLFPGTIRQNIIFNEPFNKERYHDVITVCALQKDLQLFNAGDETLLSDKGLNLSNGQKIRINLARAIYKTADIYLLDDCLSAVDLQVGKHIFWECIKGFLSNKLCVLVSHSYRFISDVDDVLLLSRGTVAFFGSYLQLQEVEQKQVIENLGISSYEHETAVNEFRTFEDTDVSGKRNSDNMAKLDKNIYEENKEKGSVKRDVYFQYFLAGGIKIFIVVVILAVGRQAMETWSDYFIRFWVESEQKLISIEERFTTNSSEYIDAQSSHNSIMSQYSLVIFAAVVFVMLHAFIFYIFAGRASVNLHRQLLNKILNASMTFFDKNLAGNIINRFSRDFSIVDEHLPFSISECIRATLTMVAVIVAVSSVNPWFLIPSVCFTLMLYIGRRLYVPSGRNIRRIEGSTRSPMIGHMQATFDGLTTIRASGAQKILADEFDIHQDVYNSTQYMHLATVQAFSFYLDIFTGIYIAIIIFTLPFIGNSLGAGKVGLAITQSFALTGLLQWCVLQWSELDIQMTSAERVLEYLKAEPENKTGDSVDLWPNKGKVEYKNVSLRYLQNSELVLKDINFPVKAGEKIGIIGRTGAGKSTIVSALFRLYEFEGVIAVDDVDINTLEVETLRSKISIMPQDPILFSGTIRTNLDPKLMYSDKQLWSALEEVEMKSVIGNLDLAIKENSNSFSLGQKQLICLARLILQNNPILVLDEATANVDSATDFLIQSTIRRIFAESTIITIAHRLHTVMDCDKILVMDAGRVLEYGSPDDLLTNNQGVFYNMIKESGLLTSIIEK